MKNVIGRGHGNFLPGDHDSVLVPPHGYQLRSLNLLRHEHDLRRQRDRVSIAFSRRITANLLFHGGDFLLQPLLLFRHARGRPFIGSAQFFLGSMGSRHAE